MDYAVSLLYKLFLAFFLLLTILIIGLFVFYCLHKRPSDNDPNTKKRVYLFDAIIGWWNKYPVPILFFLGIFFMGVGYAFLANNKDDYYIVFISKFGELLAISGVFSFLSNSGTILEGYRKELNDFLYSKKYLSGRNDIEKIWKDASSVLFKAKFPNIKDELLTIISDTYLPNSNSICSVSYYENYTDKITIEWGDDDFVKIQNITTFNLISDSDEEFEFVQENWIHVPERDQEKAYASISIEVDGKEKNIANGKMESGDLMHTRCVAHLKGRSVYKIEKICERSYNLNTDNLIQFGALCFTKGLNVSVVHPESMRISCCANGLRGHIKQQKLTEKCCLFQYNELILPEQGYIIAMSKK